MFVVSRRIDFSLCSLDFLIFKSHNCREILVASVVSGLYPMQAFCSVPQQFCKFLTLAREKEQYLTDDGED